LNVINGECRNGLFFAQRVQTIGLLAAHERLGTLRGVFPFIAFFAFQALDEQAFF
jgi:hypothetical protein